MLTWPEEHTPPAGNTDRFGGRWRLVGAGLSNVWRYGDLDLPAPSGRLLLRGANGTGKTTALEVLWPYLLDLNAALLAAGKARNTHLSGLMKEGAEGRRRVGYLWLTFATPGDEDVVSYGVRLNFSEGSTPPVKVNPFTVPGRPLHELALWGPGRSTLTVEQFAEAIAAPGGAVFGGEDDYVRDLATRVFATEARDLVQLAGRIRQVRNPALLGEVSPRAAADALRESLPGVADDVIDATGEALAESDATRKAFEADRDAASALEEFARVWSGHAVEVTAATHARADETAAAVRKHTRERDHLDATHKQSIVAASDARKKHQDLNVALSGAHGRLEAIERSHEYKEAGRLNELAISVANLGRTAAAQWSTLEHAAHQAAQHADGDLDRARELAEDIASIVGDVATLAPAVAGTAPLAIEPRPRAPLHVGDRAVDAGPVLHVRFDAHALDAAVDTLRACADEVAKHADRAKVYVVAHIAVADKQTNADRARSEAERLALTAEEKDKLGKSCTSAAIEEAARLGVSFGDWLADAEVDPGWSQADLDDVDWTDTPAALGAVDRLAEGTSDWAHRSSAADRNRAEDLDRGAGALRLDAAARRAEAHRIRDNDVLLPLPRPEWAGPGDDDMAFGSAVDWADDVDADTQDVVEATLAASGLLGATFTAAGLETTAWVVDAAGPAIEANLGSILRPDPTHPMTGMAAAVGARIALAPTAASDAGSGFVVGIDGTFRAGVLTAAVPEAQDPQLRHAARHIGARRRREAALSHADELEAEADDLDRESGVLEGEAETLRHNAEQTLGRLARLPRREGLRDAESSRVAAVLAAREATSAAAAAERHADEATTLAADLRRRWTEDVTSAGLPPEVEELTELIATAKADTGRLREAAGQLHGKFRSRLVAFAAAIAEHDTTAELAGYHSDAKTSWGDAHTARAKLDELQTQVGSTAAEATRRHQEVSARLDELGPQVAAADDASRDADNEVASMNAHLDEANRRVEESRPVAAQRLAELRMLLAVPGVVEAVLGEEAATDDELLVQVGTAVASKPTSAKRTVRERADATRAQLAGVWALDPGVDHPELDTYLLTHGTASLPPVAAAAHARVLADRAEESLRAADEAALRDFVIGRLPAAVAQAWTRLFDWVGEVNTKMRSASASSGVGVAVRVSVRDDLPPAVRTVYELACKTGDALRNPDARAQAGHAIQQLINAADGDDMAARVRAAVDVRDWVDVVYQVTRPGEAPRNWGSRTGLSGGERRLVVLAPMLAAVAAAYDTFPASACRLAALDEVPSEVDEDGREGLARYIAELDLDLIATSHHWDGAPGAWDGIDAHDLEAAPDGTVVAFPMLIRGLEPLPGDTMDGNALPPV